MAIGNLASKDLVGQVGDYNAVLQDDFRLMKSEFYISVDAFTSNEGPIIVGIADGQLTDAEIEECIEARPNDRNHNVAHEQSQRPVWPLCILDYQSVGAKCSWQDEKTLKWTFSDTEAWKYWVYNPSGAALSTGGVVRIFAKHYGVWVT